MRGRFALFTALTLTLPLVLAAQAPDTKDVSHDRREVRHDRRELRSDRRDIKGDVKDIRQDRREIRQDVKSGDVKEARQDRRDLRADRRGLPPHWPGVARGGPHKAANAQRKRSPPTRGKGLARR